MQKIVVIADDLTGAADTGVLFVPVVREMRLLSAAQFGALSQNGGFEGVAVCTDSRSMPASDAGRIVSNLSPSLKHMGGGLVYKKIDSCLRGHVGIELLNLLNGCGRRAALVAPAYPRLGRTTVQDVHYVNSIPVAQSEAGQDPVRPVISSLLSENLALGHNQPVGKIGISIVQAGEASLVSAIKKELEAGKRLIAVDAETDEQLGIIAGTALKHFPDLILSGSAGLAQAIAAMFKQYMAKKCSTQVKTQSWSFKPNQAPLLFVGGSASTVLRSQLEKLAKNHSIDLEVLNAAEVFAGLPEERKLNLKKRLKNNSLIITLSPPNQSQEKLPSQDLVQALAKLAAELVDEPGTKLSALFVSGGDTAQAVLEMLGSPEMLIECELAPGFIVSRFAEGKQKGLYFLTKSGSFGDAEMLAQVYSQLKQNAV